MMEYINNLKSGCAAKMNAYETEKTRIDAKIARLQKKREKLIYPHWTELLVRPIIKEVARRTPDIVWQADERLYVFGMRCECFVSGKTSEGHTVGIMFTPYENSVAYDTGEESRAFEHNDWNGFNNISKPVESIDELVAMIRKNEQDAIDKQKTKTYESKK